MLDPRYPKARVQRILEQAGAGLVVGSRNFRHVWPDSFVAIDDTFFEAAAAAEEEEEGARCASPVQSSQTLLLPAVPGSALFCLVFTSGSTGTPKACALEHAAFASMAAPFARAARLGPTSRVRHVAPYSFIGGLAEVVLALAAGACLCVPAPEPSYLTRFPAVLRDMAVNWADITSGVAELLDPLEAPGLATLLLSGEMATRRAVERWAEVDGVTLFISYGATESCSAFAVSEAPLRRSTNPGRVGMPFSGRAWIVDPIDGQRLLPDGAIGELVLGGPGLGREYLNDTARTQLVFLGSPPPWMKGVSFDTHDSWHACRFYKSGDLAFFGPDGAIHLVGRKDTQAKLRGQRIELGEVEYHIRHLIPGHASIAEVIRPRGFPNEVLVVFVPSQAEETKDDQQSLQKTRRMLADGMDVIIAQLRGLLPAYMVPSAFIAIGQMPLTRSGKIDRKGLRDTGATLSVESVFGISAPSGPTDAHRSKARLLSRPMEHRLRKLWERTFERELKGATADVNFFRVGGDSLLAAKLSSLALRDGIELSFADVLGHPTLETQAQVASIIPQPESRTRGPVDLSFFSASMKEKLTYATDFQASILAGELTWRASEVHFFTLNFDPPLSLDYLRSALLSFVSHHASLRTVFKIDHQKVYQMVLDKVPEDTVLSIVVWNRQKTAKPKVKTGPQIIKPDNLVYPLHFTLLRDTRDSQHIHRLVFRISHTLFDGAIFTRFCTELRLLLSGKPLPTYYPYASLMESFAIRQAAGVEYWRSILSRAEPTELINRAHHPIHDAADSIVRHTVAFPDMENIDVSLSTMLNSAWAVTLSQLLNQRDVLFGVYVAMRNLASAEARHTLGCTLTVIPMRANIGREPAPPGMVKTASHRTIPQSLHAQFVASLPHAASMVHAPSRPRLSTLLLHKNEADVREEEQEEVPFCVEGGGSGSCSGTVTCRGTAADAVGGYGDDFEILTLPNTRAGTLTLEAYFCGRVIPEETAKEILCLFGRNLEHLVRGQEECVSVVASTALPDSLRGLFPLRAASPPRVPGRAVEPLFSPVPPDHLVEAVVDAWNAVFGDCWHAESTDLHRSNNGRPPEDWHPIAAYSLAQRYRELGCSISMDDVLEDMSISGHATLLERRGPAQLRRGKSVSGVRPRSNV
jgi:non-ribosomal peptide synthetase component F